MSSPLISSMTYYSSFDRMNDARLFTNLVHEMRTNDALKDIGMASLSRLIEIALAVDRGEPIGADDIEALDNYVRYGHVSGYFGGPVNIRDARFLVDPETRAKWDAFGSMQEVEGFVVHHTGGNGTVEGVVNTFKERNFPAHYIIDRDGIIYQILSDNMRGQHIMSGNGFADSQAPYLSNANTLGVEIMAHDDADVLPVQ